MIELRPEQRTTVDRAKEILAEKHIVYMACEVRVGKTIMSFNLAKESGWKRVLFVTKKKALTSVDLDYKAWGQSFELFWSINFEKLEKLKTTVKFDGIIIDEAHSLGQHPKPSNRTKNLRELIGESPVIFLSGTPYPETPSQIYHQFWVTQHGPFQEYKNFYKWAHEYVDIKRKIINGWPINDYSRAKEEKIKDAIRPYMVYLTQEEAGFTSLVDEEILSVKIDEKIYRLMEALKRDRIYTMKTGDVLLADTSVRLQSLYHQVSSGTVTITTIDKEQEIRKRRILDESKAWFIRGRFAGQKIAIFYKFIAEGELLRRVFPDHTDDPQEFNRHEHLVFICQVVSGREGTNLSTADALVMYNIDFSATSYWQARARMQTKTRTKASKLYWIFSEHGIEWDVYKAVSKKKNYTLDLFKKKHGLRAAHGRKQTTKANYLGS